MRILFMGCGEFGRPALRRLRNRVARVVTAPDRPAGRGLKNRPTPVRALAEELGLPVQVVADINRAPCLEELRALRTDAILMVDFGQLVNSCVFQLPSGPVLNIHPSLLPRYRGSAPIERAIYNRDPETGVTIFQVVRRMDAGPILLQERLAIGPEEDAEDLADRLAELGAALAEAALDQVAAGTARPVPQDEKLATYAPRLTRADGRIDWTRSAEDLAAQVRAFVRWPRSCTLWEGQPIIICRARALPGPAAPPGTLLGLGPDGLCVACGRGVLQVTELQPAGRKRMAAGDFARGRAFASGLVLR